jgi:hypothetical protein
VTVILIALFVGQIIDLSFRMSDKGDLIIINFGKHGSFLDLFIIYMSKYNVLLMIPM